MTLAISVYSDVICPWCLLGKRRLERALAETGIEARLEWLPFELNPDMPESGMERAAYRAAKFGRERAAQLDAEMTARGAEDGVAFAFDRIARTPNTRKAHLLIAHAARSGRGDAVKEALMRAYFEAARDVGDEAVLLPIAAALGLDEAACAAALRDPAVLGEVLALERRAAAIGVTGVPFFIVEGRWAVSGAQPSAHWVALLRERVATPDRPASA